MKIIIIAALTADGFIGRSTTHLATDWTSQEDKRHFVRLSKEVKHMVMGLNTYKTIGKGLPGRFTYVYSDVPIDDPNAVRVTDAPSELAKRLQAEGVETLLICGGATIYNMFMQAGIVDELYLTYEPVAFGQGLSLFKGALDTKLKLLEVEHEANSIFAHYRIQK